ncbi:hypothetical protein VTI74DRAFT_5946 [Chaetomium olivicolor]
MGPELSETVTHFVMPPPYCIHTKTTPPKKQPIMVSEDRQRTIEINRSLRLIKNELESLLEKGIIDDAAFDSITSLLPAESPLSGAAARTTTTTTNTTANLPTPAPSTTASSPAPTHNPSAPPSYAQSTATPPSLPSRNPAPAPAAPAKPVLAYARALYRYTATDARDCSFERDDRIAVHEYMNADWWMGRNERTGDEGIFPKSYVVVDEAQAKNNNPHQQLHQPQSSYYPVSPVPVGGYPSAPPPGQPVVPYQNGQQQQQGDGSSSKFEENGKKFGKKLGNAAIFGAGATLGGKIVNSIF